MNVESQLSQFFDDGIEPKPLCRNCEYADFGGIKEDGSAYNKTGDCHNRASPRFTTTLDETCNQFFPCSTRWPDADHGDD
jgi:hypothetical protein